MNRMRPVLAGAVLSGLLLNGPQLLPGTPPESSDLPLLIHDAGQPRQFDLAYDELHVVARSAPPLVRFPAVGSRAALLRHAEAWSLLAGAPTHLVLYERDLPRTDATRRVLTRRVAVKLAETTLAARLAADTGAVDVQPVPGLPGWFCFEAAALDGAPALADRLRVQPSVRFAEPLLARTKRLKHLPNDAYFPEQWHLRNTGQNGGTPGIDINVTNVWNLWTGAGITVATVDDGLQTDHPDLAPNVNTAMDWDFNGNDGHPYPDLLYDQHGTPVAGIVAARGQNFLGGAGVAFDATLVGLRLLGQGNPTTDEQDAACMLHSNALIQVKNNSWGADDGRGALEGPSPLLAEAIVEGTVSGRGGKGTIYTFAGGNGRAYGEDVNYDGYANAIHVFAVGAVNDRGQQASFSEPGACLVVCAPSGNGSYLCSGGPQNITTTDLTGTSGRNAGGSYCDYSDGNYTRNFSGTSASTPIVSGVIALLLQANPALGWRDVKEILLRSATRLSPADPDWHTNTAGLAHNHKLGAGLVNAGAALALATNWTPLGPLTHLSLLRTNLGLAVPDNAPGGITNTLTVTNVGFRVEHAALTVTLPHTRHGQLAITLTSPAGTPSRLAEFHSSTGPGYHTWTFTSVRHWGEHAAGTWTVKIADLAPGETGTLQALDLRLYGSVPRAELTLTRINGHALVTLRVPAPGWSYALETSTNLTHWADRGTLRVSTAGEATLLDTNALVNARFYRARLLPTVPSGP